ncbi:oxidoreductase [Vibrio nigripulchritudo]|uniref:VOC family protein n=1 Tax=Vibrio nigripulchritudo TaxID=28173 RepID=UPI00190B1B30|nr:VOC family protein [Vibrio nigripulchritudo]BCL73309.1 oxidoreductase [Vibrio nigripulchritudo]BDU34675.1 oxidoreductase [Vibrio nigripulchritudo]
MDKPIRVHHLRSIVMRAPDITQTEAFYVDAWGLEVAFKGEGITYFKGTGEEPFIYGIRNDDTYGIDYIHFGMDSRKDIERLYQQVLSHQCPVVVPPQEFDDQIGGFGFEILDPDNRRLRFTADLELQSAKEVHSLPKKLSHVVLNTPIFDELKAWYVDVLGFRVSDYSADMMVFLRCNSDHHSIALVNAKYPSVNHVAFEMTDVNSFMRGIGRMKSNQFTPSWGPGRHGPGDNPFAYFVSPSGFVIEFTSDLQQIDEHTHEAQVWPRTDPEAMDQWMTAGPPTNAQRAAMQGRPDYGFPEYAESNKKSK